MKKTNASWYARYHALNLALIDQAMVSGSSFVTSALLVRFLGLQEFGRFSIVWMVVLFGVRLQMASIVAPMQSIGGSINSSTNVAYFQSSVYQALPFALFLGVLVHIGFGLLNVASSEWDFSGLTTGISVMVFLFLFQDFLRRYFYTRDNPGYALLIDIVSYGGQIGSIVLLDMANWATLPNVIWAISLTSGLAIVSGCTKVDWHLPALAALKTSIYRNAKFSSWMVLATPLQWLAGNIFILVLAAVLGPFAAGVVKAAQNVMALLNVIFAGLENVVPVEMANRLARSGLEAMRSYAIKVLGLGMIPTLSYSVFVAFFPHVMLNLFYGTNYSESTNILQIFSLLYPLTLLTILMRFVLRTLDDTLSISIAYALAASISILLVKPLVAWLGYSSVPVGMILAQVSMVVWFSIRLRSAWKRKVPHIVDGA